MVDMTHYRDDRCTRTDLATVSHFHHGIFKQVVIHNKVFVTHLFRDQNGRILIKRLVYRRHDTHLKQHLDNIG